MLKNEIGKVWFKRRRFAQLVLAFVGLIFISSSSMAQDTSDASITKSIVSVVETGTLVCTKKSSGDDCGSDHWVMTQFRNGIRALRSSMRRSGTQVDAFLRVDDEFLPIDGFVHTYVRGEFLGVGLFVVDKGVLAATVNGPDGLFRESFPLPDRFSFLSHAVSADGWHFGYLDRQKDSQFLGAFLTVGAARRSVLVKQLDMPITFIAVEQVSVPAGVFEAQHYRIGDNMDVWVAGDGMIVVKHVFKDEDVWELAEYSRVIEPD